MVHISQWRPVIWSGFPIVEGGAGAHAFGGLLLGRRPDVEKLGSSHARVPDCFVDSCHATHFSRLAALLYGAGSQSPFDAAVACAVTLRNVDVSHIGEGRWHTGNDWEKENQPHWESYHAPWCRRA